MEGRSHCEPEVRTTLEKHGSSMRGHSIARFRTRARHVQDRDSQLLSPKPKCLRLKYRTVRWGLEARPASTRAGALGTHTLHLDLFDFEYGCFLCMSVYTCRLGLGIYPSAVAKEMTFLDKPLVEQSLLVRSWCSPRSCWCLGEDWGCGAGEGGQVNPSKFVVLFLSFVCLTSICWIRVSQRPEVHRSSVAVCSRPTPACGACAGPWLC